MLTLYIVTAVVGGLLVLLSVFTGDHGEHAAESGTELALDHGAGADAAPHHEGPGDGGPWIPFFSVRFWTYFAMSFGVCGLLLKFAVGTQEPLTAALAGGAGLVIGLGVAFLMRVVSRDDTDSSIAPKELMGREAQVVVAVRGGHLGRVRLHVKGEILEVLATTDEPADLEVGDSAVIIDMDGDRVKVVHRETVFGAQEVLEP